MKKVITLLTLSLIAGGTTGFLAGCYERTERVEEVRTEEQAPVAVPESDVDVDVRTEPAPDVIQKETETNTTIENNGTTGESSRVETRKETTVQ